ncbi:PAS domain S-box protein [Danxiaibacter flavus]|uniref:histidine kinase n=1 Tax=Danxiaibacter flavus TaxID=3049108 RepID=A0ABV3ZCZ3_9BACT|nr:PAS domain S-box protein [Chitinophagaceae bacterium DXS]
MGIQYNIILRALNFPSLLLKSCEAGWRIDELNGGFSRLLDQPRQLFTNQGLCESAIFSDHDINPLIFSLIKCVAERSACTVSTSEYGQVVLNPVYEGNILQFLFLSVTTLSADDVESEIYRLKSDLFFEEHELVLNGELIHAENDYKIVFDKSPLPSWMFDNETMCFVDVNEAAVAHYGYSKDEFLSMTIADIAYGFGNEIVERQKTGFTKTGTDLHRKKNGEKIWVEYTCCKLKEDDERITLVVADDITEKRKAENDLLLYKNIIDNSKDAIGLLGKDGMPIFMNESMRKTLGKTEQELADAGGILGVYKDKQQAADVMLTIFSGNYWSGDVSLITKGNDVQDFYLSAGAVKDEKGELVAAYGIHTDITERKQLERELREYNQRITTLLESITDGFCALDNNWIITIWNKEAEKVTGINRSQVLGRVLLDAFPEVGEMGIYETCLAAKKENTARSLEQYIALLDKWIELNIYPSEAGMTVYFRNITEKKRAQEEIENANKEKLQILESIEDAFFAVNDQNIVTYWNREAERLLLMPRENILGKNLWEVYSQTTQHTSYAALEKSMNERVVGHFEEYYAPLNIWLEASVYPSQKGVSVYFKDITERKVAQEKLLHSNKQLEWAEQIGKLGYWSFDLKDNAIFWSKEVYRIFERDEELFTPDYDTFYNSIHPDDQHLFDEGFRDALAGKEIYPITHRVILHNGKLKWLMQKAVIIFRKDEQPIFEGVVQDITEEKESELKLKLSNERYDYASKATSDAIWDWDLLTGEIFCAEGYKRLFGYEEEKGDNKIFFDRIHPDDRRRIAKSMAKKLKDASSSVWQDEYRYLKSNGEYAYVYDRAFMLFDDKGRPVRMIGAMQDVTARKNEEQQLKLFESVITNARDMVLISNAPETAADLVILYANDALTELTGYSKEEVLGKHPSIFHGPRTCQKEIQKLGKAINQRKPCEIEVISRKKNGDEYWSSISVVPVVNKAGQCTHFISIERDITDRKKSELEKDQLIKELTQNNKELKQFSYITSHNLRAPLTNLMSIAELIDYDSITDETMTLLMDGFKKSTWLLNETINDLVNVLIIKEQNNPYIEKLHFQDVWNAIASATSQLAAKSNAMIHVDFTEAETVMFNKNYLESIFMNLLTNSLKYAHPGRTPEISVKSRMKNNSVQLLFTDNGLGFDLKRIGDRIFGLYQRFHNYPDSKGIGLFLVHSQVTSSGGKIQLESKVNQGSTFTITFKP